MGYRFDTTRREQFDGGVGGVGYIAPTTGNKVHAGAWRCAKCECTGF